MSAPPLNMLSGQPQVGAAFSGWQRSIIVIKRTETITNGLVGYSNVPVSFKGIIQPLGPKSLALKPEGQRAWQWLQIHCMTLPVALSTGDVIIYNGVTYKIMADNDYSLNGYREFHACEDYQS